MAIIELTNTEMVVSLSRWEKLGAFRGDVHVPLAEVRSVRTSDLPWAELRGMRAPGTGIPGVIALCTRRGNGFKDFSAVYRKDPVVVIECEGGTFDRLVITTKDPAGDTARIAAALPAN